jgi:hypothetical protein
MIISDGEDRKGAEVDFSCLGDQAAHGSAAIKDTLLNRRRDYCRYLRQESRWNVLLFYTALSAS